MTHHSDAISAIRSVCIAARALTHACGNLAERAVAREKRSPKCKENDMTCGHKKEDGTNEH